MLCRFCEDLDLDALDTIEGYHHHSSFKALEVSAAKGCSSCGLIRDAHQEYEGGVLTEGWVGSSEDAQITMHMSHRGYIDIAQIERVKSNHRPFLKSILHICTLTGKYGLRQ